MDSKQVPNCDLRIPSNMEVLAFYRKQGECIRPVHVHNFNPEIKGNPYLRGLSACREVQLLRERIKIRNTPLAIDYHPPEDLEYLIPFFGDQLEANKICLNYEHKVYQDAWNKEKEIWSFFENSEAFFLLPYPTSLKIELREADLNELKKDFSTEFPLKLVKELLFFCYLNVSLKHTIKKVQTNDAGKFVTKALDEHVNPMLIYDEYDLFDNAILDRVASALDCLFEASEILGLDNQKWLKYIYIYSIPTKLE